MKKITDIYHAYQSNRVLSRIAKAAEKLCIEHPEKISPEAKARNWEDMYRRIQVYESRMKTDPAYAREMKKCGRREDIYLFFHPCSAAKNPESKKKQKKPDSD